jgi:hypothetical protein
MYKYHRYSKHPLYPIWKEIRYRCYNPNHKDYKYYGGRDIKVCDEWMNPKTFIEWCLKKGWRKGLEIDRRDNDGDYCPKNCRFIIHEKNIHNTKLLRNNNTSGYRGVSKKNKKWGVRIMINNKQKYLGLFNLPEEAAMAYDKAVPDNRPKNFT